MGRVLYSNESQDEEEDTDSESEGTGVVEQAILKKKIKFTSLQIQMKL